MAFVTMFYEWGFALSNGQIGCDMAGRKIVIFGNGSIARVAFRELANNAAHEVVAKCFVSVAIKNTAAKPDVAYFIDPALLEPRQATFL